MSRVGVDGHLVAVLQQKSDHVDEGKWMTELFDLDTFRQEQYRECEIGQVIKAMQENGTIDEECSKGGLGRAHSKGCLRLGFDGILRFLNYRGRTTRSHPLGIKEELLVVLPRSLRRRMLLLVHNSPLSGHMGQDRTWERAHREAWRPYMKKDVVAYVQDCDSCQLHKRKKLDFLDGLPAYLI